MALGTTYTHAGQPGNYQVLYNYYMQTIGNYVDPNVVYGILVAKDGQQQTSNVARHLLCREILK